MTKLLWLSPLAAACFLNGLAGPEHRLVIGQITRVERDQRYEQPCGVKAALFHACDEMPTCCAYQVTVEDSAGHRTYFMAFWPKYAPGLQPWRRAWFNLTRERIVQLGRCAGPYGCPEDVTYVVESDSDWGYVP